jgi:hypothetical protein
MLKRANKLDLPGCKAYLKSIVREFVEKPGKIRVTSESGPFTIRYHVSVHRDDLAILEEHQRTYISLNHLMNKVTLANLDKGGSVDNEFGVTE